MSDGEKGIHRRGLEAEGTHRRHRGHARRSRRHDGKVILPEGLTWIRYWVRFDNGVVRGTIDRSKLARPGEWAELVRRRAAGEDTTVSTSTSGGNGAPAAAAAEGESVMVNGIPVPGFLIERSKARREFLGV